MSSFLLKSERLVLCQFEKRHVEAFFAYRNDPEITKYQGWNIQISRPDAEQFVETMAVISIPKKGSWVQIAIELKGSKLHIGDCALKLDEAGQTAEFGITVSQNYQNLGYGSEAIKRLFAYCFDDLSLHRIIGYVDCDNVASINLMTKIGMRKEAHFVESFLDGNVWRDEFLYAMLKSDWN